ncbi:MAG: hypothetical protein Q8M92_03075, partial [Candidatus Subteraquimicrobiales bacterium]|nr:hypothetical protein [Candidatus Subteraquimicrobiales bacterium]
HKGDKHKVYEPLELIAAAIKHYEYHKGEGIDHYLTPDRFYGRDLLFKQYLPWYDHLESVGETKEQSSSIRVVAVDIYNFYAGHLKPSTRKVTAIKNIESCLRGKTEILGEKRKFTKDELIDAIVEYGKTKEGMELKWIKDPANFFGQDKAFYHYLPENLDDAKKQSRNTPAKEMEGVVEVDI